LGNKSPIGFEAVAETESSNGKNKSSESALTVVMEQKAAEEPVNGDQWLVLNELVIALIRKRVLSHDEGQGMLRKLYEKKILQ